MLVGPPESLKTSIVEVLNSYNTAYLLGDLNNQQLAKMREDIASGRISTLAFTEFSKLYARAQAVSSNLESQLALMVAEGLRTFGHQNPQMPVIPAYCTVIGCMTIHFHRENFDRWRDCGFYRRFLWATYKLDDPGVITDAIDHWQKLEFSTRKFQPAPLSRHIPYNVTDLENEQIKRILHFQMSSIGYAMMKKILCVLKWKYPENPRLPMQILRDFAPLLGKEGGILKGGTLPGAEKVLSNGHRKLKSKSAKAGK